MSYSVVVFTSPATSTTVIYTLSLHDALPISAARYPAQPLAVSDAPARRRVLRDLQVRPDVRRDHRLPGLPAVPGHGRFPLGGLEALRAPVQRPRFRPAAVEHTDPGVLERGDRVPGAGHRGADAQRAAHADAEEVHPDGDLRAPLPVLGDCLGTDLSAVRP